MSIRLRVRRDAAPTRSFFRVHAALRSGSLHVLIAAFLLGVPSPLRAATLTYDAVQQTLDPGTGVTGYFFENPANWSEGAVVGAGPPGAGDTVVLGVAPTPGDVQFAANATTAAIELQSAGEILSLNGFTYAAGDATIGGGLGVADGTLQTHDALLADVVSMTNASWDLSGTLTVNTAAQPSAGPRLFGGDVTAAGIRIGEDAGTPARLQVGQGLFGQPPDRAVDLTATGPTVVGIGGSGTLDVVGGSTASFGDVTLGEMATGTGQLNIGQGSQVTVSGDFLGAGAADIEVTDGGTLALDHLTLGVAGSGHDVTLLVGRGGMLTVDQGDAVIGETGATGRVTLGESTMAPHVALPADLIVGAGGDGRLDTEHLAVLDAASAFVAPIDGATGVLKVEDRSALNLSGSLYVGGDATTKATGVTTEFEVDDTATATIAGTLKVWDEGFVDFDDGAITAGSVHNRGFFRHDDGTLEVTTAAGVLNEGTYELRTATLETTHPTAEFTNQGILRKTAVGEIATFLLPFVQDSSQGFEVAEGTLAIEAGGEHLQGDVVVGPNGELQYNAGLVGIQTDVTYSGGGQLLVDGADVFVADGDTVTISTPFEMAGGSFAGEAVITVDSVWSGGTLGGPVGSPAPITSSFSSLGPITQQQAPSDPRKSKTNEPGTTFTIDFNRSKVLADEIRRNEGTAIQRDSVQLLNGRLENAGEGGDGLWQIDADGLLFTGDATSDFDNNGTFRVNAGNAFAMGVDFVNRQTNPNRGLVEVRQSSSLVLQDLSTFDGGSITVGSGATLAFDATPQAGVTCRPGGGFPAQHCITQDTVASGPGAVSLRQGTLLLGASGSPATLELADSASPNPTFEVGTSGGNPVISGTGSIRVNQMQWNTGTIEVPIELVDDGPGAVPTLGRLQITSYGADNDPQNPTISSVLRTRGAVTTEVRGNVVVTIVGSIENGDPGSPPGTPSLFQPTFELAGQLAGIPGYTRFTNGAGAVLEAGGTSALGMDLDNRGRVRVAESGELAVSGDVLQLDGATGTLTGGIWESEGVLTLESGVLPPIVTRNLGTIILKNDGFFSNLVSRENDGGVQNPTFRNGGVFRVEADKAVFNPYEVDTFVNEVGGSVVIDGGVIFARTFINSAGGKVRIDFGNSIVSTQGLIARVINGGEWSVGESPGVSLITGNFLQESTGSLEIELGGLASGTEYDRFDVIGEAVFDGTLQVLSFDLDPNDANGPFSPQDGDVFDVVVANLITDAGYVLDVQGFDPSVSFSSSIVDLGNGTQALRLLATVPEPRVVVLLGLAWLAVRLASRRSQRAGSRAGSPR